MVEWDPSDQCSYLTEPGDRVILDPRHLNED